MSKITPLIAILTVLIHFYSFGQCPDLTPDAPEVICLNEMPFNLPVQYPSFADSVVIQFESDSVRGASFTFNPYGLSLGLHYLPFTYEIYYSNQPNCFGVDSISIEVVGTQYAIDIIGDSIICFGSNARLFSVEFRNGAEQSRPVFWNGASVADSIAILTPLTTTNYYYDYDIGSLTTPSELCTVRDYFTVEVFTFDDNVRAQGAPASCEFGTVGFQFNSLQDSLEFNLLWPDSSSAAFFDTVITSNTSFNLQVTNSNYGCDTTYAFDVIMVDQTEIILDSVFDICTGQVLEINPQGGAYYSVNNDSIYLDGTSIVLRVDSDSTFVIRALREDLFLECTEEMTFDVRIFPYPDITLMALDSAPLFFDSICRGAAVSAAAMGAEMYDWYSSNDELLLGNDSAYVLQPDVSTDYFVVGWQYVCSDTDTFHIGVKQLPLTEIRHDGPFCEDSLITVWYEATDYDVLWQNQSPTNYQDWILNSDTVITLTSIDSFGCFGYDTLVVDMNENPDIEIFAPDSVCSGEIFSLAAVGAMQYEWSFGGSDSLFSTSLQNDQYFTVLGITAEGCGARDTHVVRAIDIPILTVSPNEEICIGDSAILAVYSDVAFTPMLESSQIVITPQSDTTITFVATNALGCSTSHVYQLMVHPLPSIAITGTPDACPNEVLTFQAQGAQTYYWSIENNGSSASLVVTQDSTIYVNGISAQGCFGTTSFDVNARDLPFVEISGDDFICAGGTTVLSAPSAYWLLWEGVIADSQIVLNNIFSDTLIQLVATSQYGCSAEFQKWVTVSELNPDVAILGDDSLCSGENTILTAVGNAVFYWFDSLNTSTLDFIGLSSDSLVTLRAINSLGCDTVITKTIHVFPYPNIQLDDDLFSCEGQWLTVNANSDVPVLWSDGIIAPYRQLSVFSDTTLAAIALGINNCLSTDTVQIGYSTLPAVDILTPQPVCFGDTLILEAQGGLSYQWSTGDTGSSIVVIATPNQTYWVQGSNDAGCSDEDVITPVVSEPLSVQLNFSLDTICDIGGNFALTMNPSGGILSGDNVFDGIFNPSGPGLYELNYIVESPAGCISIAYDELLIENCVGLFEAKEMETFNPFPNPGNGLINWLGHIEHLQVFTPLGNKILETSVAGNQINLSNLSVGSYILVARNSSGEVLPALWYTLAE